MLMTVLFAGLVLPGPPGDLKDVTVTYREGGAGTRSTDLAWDCVYDVDWAYPENDPNCPWTRTGTTLTRSVESYGDILNLTQPGVSGENYARDVDFSADGYMWEWRARQYGGPDNSIASLARVLNPVGGSCFIETFFYRTGSDRKIQFLWGAGGLNCGAGTFDQKFVDIPDNEFVKIRVEVGPTSETGVFQVKLYVDDVLRETVSPNWSGLRANRMQLQAAGGTSATLLLDYIAYKPEITNPNAIQDLYPLPYVDPRPYPSGTRADATSAFWSLIYDWRDGDAATPAAFNLPYPLGESSVQVYRDAMYITKSSDSTSRWWINDTKSTTGTGDDAIVLNTTGAYVYLDLTGLSTTTDGENVTVQDGVAANFRTDRESEIRLGRGFNWSATGSTNEYTFLLTVTNNATRTWHNAWFSVPFRVDTDGRPSSVTVFDQANNQYLTHGLHYEVTGGTVEWEVPSIASGISRTWTVRYTAWSISESGLLGLEATTAVPDSSFTGIAFRSRVSYQQTASASFAGDVVVRMNIQDPSFTGRVVDMATIVVVDVRTSQRVTNWVPHPTQTNVFVMPDVQIPAGVVQQYDIYFAYTSMQGGTIGGFFGSDLGIVAVIVMLIVIIILAIDAAQRRLPKKPSA
jgi:hypothetical protein